MAAIHPETDLVPFFRGELSADERDRVQHHLEGCAQCRQSMEALAGTLRRVSARLDELPTPEWSAYRRELRLKLAQQTQERTRWWRPQVVWTSLATAGVGVAALVLALSMRQTPLGAAPEVAQLAMEQPAEAVDVGLLRNYPVVERLDLLEDYDIIEHLDQLPPPANDHDKRS
jgi:anti-sigma-K factor RskA